VDKNRRAIWVEMKKYPRVSGCGGPDVPKQKYALQDTWFSNYQ